jgi:hypothetical protein
LVIVGRCQGLFGAIAAAYGNDRQRDRTKAVEELTDEGFKLCVDALSNFAPVVQSGPWGASTADRKDGVE